MFFHICTHAWNPVSEKRRPLVSGSSWVSIMGSTSWNPDSFLSSLSPSAELGMLSSQAELEASSGQARLKFEHHLSPQDLGQSCISSLPTLLVPLWIGALTFVAMVSHSQTYKILSKIPYRSVFLAIISQISDFRSKKSASWPHFIHIR